MLSIALTLLLFFYTIFFYNPNNQNNIKKNEISKKNNWGLVRWVTHKDNTRAKFLYDKVAKKVAWDLYELK